MKIVIAGAGDIGFPLAQLLSYENQDIILIDTNQDVLDYAQTHLDVFTIRGDSSSIAVLKEAQVHKANLVLAVTTSEKNNLITAIMAKKLGAKQTIARVNNQEYLEEDQKVNFLEMGIDNLISPPQLAAREIARLVQQCSFTDIFEFEDGKVSLVGSTVDDKSPIVNLSIQELAEKYPDTPFKLIAILRGDRTIIPRGHTVLKRQDHIYFLSNKACIDQINRIAGKPDFKVRNVMIVGGGDVGLRSAQLLENEYNVTLVEKDKETCKLLIEKLHNTLIITGDPGNIDLLKEEGLARMDAFIAVTPNSETNIIASLMAEDLGVGKTIALVDNTYYTHISRNIGVDTIINKKLIAANNIFRFVRKGKIEALTSLHGVNAEVIEFIVHKRNRLTKHPIRALHFPEKALIGSVIRENEALIPDGDFQLEVNDRVIVFALPEAISKLEKLFR
jgi:trk system potassium uptake protein TrkA